jgi:oligopeptidase A
MTNPLLSEQTLPAFDKVNSTHIEPALDQLLKENRQKIADLIANQDYSWNTLVQPLEEMAARLEDMWSIVSHLNNVRNTKELREVYNICLPKITAYQTELNQNVALFKAYRSIKENHHWNSLTQPQQAVIKHALRDFHLAGVDLPNDKKQRFSEIQDQTAKLTTKFEENLLDATDGWQRLISDEKELAGVPEHAKTTMKQQAQEQKKPGWLITLNFPSYFAIITYADNRELRKEIYTAYVTKASDIGPNAGKWDNSQIMVDILKLRQEEAKLLGYQHFSELSLVSKMAKSTQQVNEFLLELATRSLSMAKKEWAELKHFARENYGVEQVEAWDIGYYSEKLREQKFHLTQEELRPYFPLPRVLDGLFTIVNKLYEIVIKERTTNLAKWHKDVQFFDIYDKQNKLIGGFYIDLFARPQKNGGAWMDTCKIRYRNSTGELHIPIAFLNCNFTAPSNNSPALLTHEEVLTLFHEFGHGLHHLLTSMEYPSISGISGVAWDAVELPSQLMENWCWQKAGLELFARHYKTQEQLPDEMFQKLHAAKNFQAGMQMVRQLEFSLFDFRLHEVTDIHNAQQIQSVLDETRRQITVVPIPSFNRFQHSFSHVFAGGYAAGYYSYKWAEVLSCDVFTQFEKNGIFDAKTAQNFLQKVLAKGGSGEPMQLFIDFMGREPKIDALLRDNGIEA